ncbi:ABC transporter permease [Streptomyces sp. NPDC092296]|uniref:ABC transporter permease n=1 Tax=Streptomyces sp. NPDC092296 TaxID=3366012 RepID=UPI0037FC560E
MLSSRAQAFVAKYGIVAVLLVLIAVATVLYPRFLSAANLRDILSQNAGVGIVAIGMTYVILARGFDLSVGSIYALGATVFAGFSVSGNPIVAGIVALLIGTGVGLVNGLLVTRLKVNPFVATLGSSSAISGLAFIYSHSAPFVVGKPDFQMLGLSSLGTVPTPALIFIVLAVAAGLVLSRTNLGRNIYAVGGNPEASRLSGLRVPVLVGGTYVLTGLLATLAGMIDASRLGVGQADVGGTVALDAIAVVVIGGTSLLGGEGAIWRTVVGLFILATLTNMFYSLNVSQNWQLIAKGVIVVAAVAMDGLLRSRRARRPQTA